MNIRTPLAGSGTDWRRRGESNPRILLGRQVFYH